MLTVGLSPPLHSGGVLFPLPVLLRLEFDYLTFEFGHPFEYGDRYILCLIAARFGI
jgi:hypothetical protein